MTFRRTKRASTAGSITWVVVPGVPGFVAGRAGLAHPPIPRPAFPGVSSRRRPVLPAGRCRSEPESSRRAGSADRSGTSHRDRARRRSPRAGAPARRPRGSAWRRRPAGARSSRSSTPAGPFDSPDSALAQGGPALEELGIMTHRRSDTRTARRRSRRPAPRSRSCGRRARSVRAPARTAPGPGSSPASRAGRRAA